jgi:hypothetical protein
LKIEPVNEKHLNNSYCVELSKEMMEKQCGMHFIKDEILTL